MKEDILIYQVINADGSIDNYQMNIKDDGLEDIIIDMCCDPNDESIGKEWRGRNVISIDTTTEGVDNPTVTVHDYIIGEKQKLVLNHSTIQELYVALQCYFDNGEAFNIRKFKEITVEDPDQNINEFNMEDALTATTFEIKNNTGMTQEVIDTFETEDLTYDGEDLWDLYMGWQDEVCEQIGIGKSFDYSYNEDCTECGGDGVIWGEETDTECECCCGKGYEPIDSSYTLDGQECYMGYDPTTDLFYNAYDVWSESDEYVDNVAVFRIDKDGYYTAETTLGYGNMFYSGGYKTLKECFPNIIDIRLD